jgi:integrase
MASSRKLFTKDGTPFYEISVSRGRDKSRLSTRWYPPHGWSQRAIDKELKKQEASFEKAVKEGKILSKEEQKERDRLRTAEEAKIKTLKQYCKSVYMPTITVDCSENTRSSYQGNLEKWIYPALGDIKITEITAAQIDALFISMKTQGKSHATVIKVYNILFGIFKKAYKHDLIEKNPMDKVTKPEPRKDEIRKQDAEAYTAEEIIHIWNSLEHEPLKWRVYVRLLIDTGARRGEICGLQWKDINFKENKITIAGNLCYTKDKGVYLDTPKNGKVRTVDVDPSIMALLQQLRREQFQKFFAPYVFTQEDYPDPMHPQSPTRYLKKFEKKCGVPDLHPHKLRHSFASIAITNGADIASISEVLGHTDKAVTLRMYTHADQKSMERASQIFRNAVNQNGGETNTKPKRQ